jgi:hypothetical protein
MSFISDLAKYVVNSVFDGNKNIGASVAQFTVNQVLNSVNRANDTGTGTIGGNSTAVPSLNIQKNVNAKSGTRIQMDPDLSTHIPVYYGEYITSGIITDAALSDDGLTMTYCYVISEATNQSDFLKNKLIRSGSTFFRRIYVNGEKIITGDLGYDVAGSLLPNIDAEDETFNPNASGSYTEFSDAFAGKIEVHLYDGNSETPAKLGALDWRNISDEDAATFNVNSLPYAYNVMPGWNSLYKMRDLVFAIVKVKYSPEAKLTSVPKIEFECFNPCTLPGDVIYDYMTSDRYGCDIPEDEIFR